MTQGPSTEIDAVITATGDLVVPSEVVRQLSLIPGQRVRLTVRAAVSRRNMYGALAGHVPDVSAEERREVWGDLADRQ